MDAILVFFEAEAFELEVLVHESPLKFIDGIDAFGDDLLLHLTQYG